MSDGDPNEPNWDMIAKGDATVRMLQEAGLPLTRENYIGLKYGEPGTEDHPAEWTAEHEMDLPHPFQRR
jgi:hypothetical protein